VRQKFRVPDRFPGQAARGVKVPGLRRLNYHHDVRFGLQFPYVMESTWQLFGSSYSGAMTTVRQFVGCSSDAVC
jgi:hypothetical protein